MKLRLHGRGLMTGEICSFVCMIADMNVIYVIVLHTEAYDQDEIGFQPPALHLYFNSCTYFSRLVVFKHPFRLRCEVDRATMHYPCLWNPSMSRIPAICFTYTAGCQHR
jgi:hypothetical protein